MKKRNILMLLMSVTLVILLILNILANRFETDAIIDYDRENTIEIDGVPGGILVKEKKYEYNGTDVMILNVDNQTENAYTILIKSCFTKEDGTKENKVQWFTGFPARHQNYFVLQPGYRFTDYEFEIKTQLYSGETLADHISWDNDLTVEVKPSFLDYYGNHLDEHITFLQCSVDYKYEFPKDSRVSLNWDSVIFDNQGKIYLIKNKSITYDTNNNYGERVNLYSDLLDTPWEDYKLPPELKGDIKAIVALKSIEIVE